MPREAHPHPDAAIGLVARGAASDPKRIREQSTLKSDSMFGLFRARLDELGAALKGPDDAERARCRACVVALLRMKELTPDRAAKRVGEIEAAILGGTPPDKLVPPMPTRGSTVAQILRDSSLDLSKTPDRTQAHAQRTMNLLLATLEACGLTADEARARADALIAAW